MARTKVSRHLVKPPESAVKDSNVLIANRDFFANVYIFMIPFRIHFFFACNLFHLISWRNGMPHTQNEQVCALTIFFRRCNYISHGAKKKEHWKNNNNTINVFLQPKGF